MTRPLIALGHNIALGSLLPLLYPARVDPVAPVDREYSIAGTVSDLGFFTCYHWDFFDSEADYQLNLGQFGVETADQADVTIYVKNRILAWTRYNGVALLPEMGQDIKWENFFPRGIALYVVDLEELA